MGFRMKGPTFFSVKGYKKDSPDVDKPHNIINSGDITMEDVEFDVRGEDNLGNVKIMKPGNNYKFPGNIVKETPLKQKCYINDDGKEVCPYVPLPDLDESEIERRVKEQEKNKNKEIILTNPDGTKSIFKPSKKRTKKRKIIFKPK